MAVLGEVPVFGQQQLRPLQRAGPVRDHPGQIGERGEQPARDPQTRFLHLPDLAAGLGDQLLAARSQMPQPAPRLTGRPGI
jgi:hypothetical protein